MPLPPLGVFAPPALATSFESIATTTVGSGGSSTITFSSIPSTYTHLQLRIFASTDRASVGRDVAKITFNNDTGSNYSWHLLEGDGSSAFASAGASTAFFYSATIGGNTSYFGISITDILNYANTNINKTARSLGGADDNTAAYGTVGIRSGLWRSTSAINRIDLVPLTGTKFVQYSSFALYGIKGA